MESSGGPLAKKKPGIYTRNETFQGGRKLSGSESASFNDSRNKRSCEGVAIPAVL